MHLDLSELSQLAPIFRELFKGFHISRRDPELYAQLSNFQDQYRGLFKALGFELVCDTRGFYYFVPEQAAAQVNKTAQRLALFTFILVEHLADQGRDPMSVLDGGSLGRDELPSMLEKYRDLFLQAEVQTPDDPRLYCGITSFHFTRHADQVAMAERLLKEFNLFTVAREGSACGPCIRVTPGFTTTPAEVGMLVEALRRLA